MHGQSIILHFFIIKKPSSVSTLSHNEQFRVGKVELIAFYNCGLKLNISIVKKSLKIVREEVVALS